MAFNWASLIGQSVKNLPAMQENPGSVSGLGRFPGEGNGNPLQYSCLENPIDRGDLQATVREVTRVGHDSVTNSLGIQHVSISTNYKYIRFLQINQ